MNIPEITIKETKEYTVINIGDSMYHVANHWFWKEYAQGWEPQTFNFYKKYCISGSHVLDIGAWIGPTALYALHSGAKRVIMVEPNPITCDLLEKSFNFDFQLRYKCRLLPYCVSDKNETVDFGMPDGIMKPSSASSMRGTGSTVYSITINDLINEIDKKQTSLIKIDIEGAEQYIIDDLYMLSDINAPIWLSLHPPFIDDDTQLLQSLYSLYDKFYIFDSDIQKLDNSKLINMITSIEKYPSWGTSFGNFFEIAVMPKKYFTEKGVRK